jgi:hypothetical protein
MNIQDENSVTVQLGKKGLSNTFYEEIAKNLRQNKLVKVKILKNAVESPDLVDKDVADEENTSGISDNTSEVAEDMTEEKTNDRYSYSDRIIAELEKKHKIEHKLVGRTLFLKKIVVPNNAPKIRDF